MSYFAPLLPENAPFSEGQRAWPNGWFVAYFCVEAVAPAAAPDATAPVMSTGGRPSPGTT